MDTNIEMDNLEEQSQLEAILDSVGAAIITIDESGIIIDTNISTTTLFGHPRQTMIGCNVSMLMPQPYRDEHDSYIKNHIRTGQNRIIGIGREVTGLRANGSTFPMHLSVGKFHKDGNTHFAGIVHDLTELESAQTSTARLGRIIDESVNEVYVFDTELKNFTMVNRGALANLGYTLAEMKLMSPFDIKPDHNLESFSKLLTPLFNGERERIQFQTLHQRKDQSTYDVVIDLHLSDAVDPPEFVAIVQDVTEINRIHEEHRQAQRLQSIGNLTGGIAHDFNNLLTVISGNLELLQMNITGEDNNELLFEAQDAVKMGARLTKRLLAFASKGQLSPRQINLNNLVLGLSDMLRRTLGDSIEFNCVLDPQLWGSRVDISELENALVNLAINSRDAMPNGGKLIIETSNVTVDSKALVEFDFEPGEYVKVSVADTGFGIPADLQKSIFEPFVTTKTGQHGTGLGLSMVYGFARQSGGRVTLYSEEGTGSTFSIYLPREIPSEEKTIVRSRQQPNSVSTKRILIAEDSDSVRKLTKRRLQHLGHEVIEAENGYVALDLFKQNLNIDLVFTDMVMTKGMSGYDLANAIRELDSNVRILMTSGYAEDLINPEKLEKAGFTLLRKPYQQAELVQAIAEKFRH